MFGSDLLRNRININGFVDSMRQLYRGVLRTLGAILWAVVCFSVLGGSSFAQSGSTEFNPNNPYHIAFRAYLEKRASAFSEIASKKELFQPILYRNKLIGLPQIIPGFEVRIVDSDGLDQLYREYQKTRESDSRKDLSVLEVFPMRVDGDRFEVRFADSGFSMEGRTRSFALSDGGIVKMRLDCEAKRLKVVEVELWGI